MRRLKGILYVMFLLPSCCYSSPKPTFLLRLGNRTGLDSETEGKKDTLQYQAEGLRQGCLP